MDAVFFDLDGTLADTAIDLATALNQVLIEENKIPLDLIQVKKVASHGSVALIKSGFQIEQTHPEFKSYQQRLLDHYCECLTEHPALMPGMHTILQQLFAADIPWGIVTNKPAYLTDPLVASMSLPHAPACVVSGDTVARSKPHPDSLLHACKLLQVMPKNCVYMGDAERDIQAGKAAGMRTIVALFGYLSDNDNPTRWGAEAMIHSPNELLDLL